MTIQAVTTPSNGNAASIGRRPTAEEAEAILTLVRGGWLRLELTLDTEAP